MCLVIVGVGILQLGLGFLQRWAINRTGYQIETELRSDLFAKFQKLDRTYYSDTSIGNLIVHSTSDISVQRDFVIQGVTNGFNSLFLGVLALALMFIAKLAAGPDRPRLFAVPGRIAGLVEPPNGSPLAGRPGTTWSGERPRPGNFRRDPGGKSLYRREKRGETLPAPITIYWSTPALNLSGSGVVIYPLVATCYEHDYGGVAVGGRSRNRGRSPDYRPVRPVQRLFAVAGRAALQPRQRYNPGPAGYYQPGPHPARLSNQAAELPIRPNRPNLPPPRSSRAAT